MLVNLPVNCIHGDKNQFERVMNDFKSGEIPMLKVTDVAEG